MRLVRVTLPAPSYNVDGKTTTALVNVDRIVTIIPGTSSDGIKGNIISLNDPAVEYITSLDSLETLLMRVNS